MRTLKLTILLLLTTLPVFSQLNGFYDDFEDGSLDTLWKGNIHTLWMADHPLTFGLSEGEGYLNINYNRSTESAEWDNFHFTPPEEIDVSGNPVITLRIKSDVATTFTVKPIYTNGNDDWLPQEVPADNAWHVYSFALTEVNYAGASLSKIYLYLDGGSTDEKSGLILLDDFQIAGFSIAVSDLEAVLIDSSKIDLLWQSSDVENTDHYNIYRSTESGFPADAESKIGEATATLFHDTSLLNHTTYYYQVSASDKDGREHAPASVSLRTSSPGSAPKPEVVSENANPVGTYEKYELLISITNATFTNPYDPDEIDLYAWFWSPEGDSVKMNGFYDNYGGLDQWKIRFAARQTGTWQYQVFATDIDGMGESSTGTFEVSESGQKGWLTISPDNPNYLMHDDGSSFYGVSVYYPWDVTESRLDEFAAVDGNFFGYWDCNFSSSGNGGSKYLLESMESGIGKYDQRKAARIDQVLTWAEDRDMKVMLAMWAHPFLRIEGVPWDDAKWFADNPYSTIVDIDDFYSDSLSRAYQEKHYRYMIARWGYSQSLGIWELINEMHGTTGWVRNQQGAKNWVEWVHGYFKENDPFQRPTTASFGGGDGASHFTETDKLGDMPNVHFYELHGWPNPYPNNVVRSGLANMVNESRKLKSKGDRPAFLGEAGYDHMLAGPETQEYTWEMHNTFWAGLTNGLASTPFWWDLTSRDIITDERMQLYPPLNTFVSDIDFAHQPFAPTDIWAENSDGYFMGASSTGFGWMKTFDGTEANEVPHYMSDTDLENGNYTRQWFNTWSGETAGEDRAICVDGTTWGEVPGLDEEDVAFKMARSKDGATATQIHLFLVKTDTLIPGGQPWLPGVDSTIYRIVCYVSDDSGLLDVAYMGPVQITIEGEGQAGPFTLNLTEGGVLFNYERHGSADATIFASIDGLGTTELYIEGITGIGDSHRLTTDQGFYLRNYPNPFKQKTTLEFFLPQRAQIKVAVYNAQGKLVDTLLDEHRESGQYQVEWNAGNQAGGLYFFTLRTGSLSLTKSCVIIK